MSARQWPIMRSTEQSSGGGGIVSLSDLVQNHSLHRASSEGPAEMWANLNAQARGYRAFFAKSVPAPPSPTPAQRNSGGEGRVRSGQFLSAGHLARISHSRPKRGRKALPEQRERSFPR